MSLTTNLVMSCGCGARLAFSCTYTPYVVAEREAFDKAHQTCRERRPTIEPEAVEDRRLCDPMPGGYLVSTPRDMPRGALHKPLDESDPRAALDLCTNEPHCASPMHLSTCPEV